MTARGWFLAMGLSLAAVRCLAGCALLAPRVAPALDTGAYTAALATCRAEGKDAGSYAVYEQCAREADTKYAPEGGL